MAANQRPIRWKLEGEGGVQSLGFEDQTLVILLEGRSLGSDSSGEESAVEPSPFNGGSNSYARIVISQWHHVRESGHARVLFDR